MERRKLILFAADIRKECIYFLEDVAYDLKNRNIDFTFNKYRLLLETQNAKLLCVPQTHLYHNLYTICPFDYYIFTGEANNGWSEFYKLCKSRTKTDSKRITGWEELIKLLSG